MLCLSCGKNTLGIYASFSGEVCRIREQEEILEGIQSFIHVTAVFFPFKGGPIQVLLGSLKSGNQDEYCCGRRA